MPAHPERFLFLINGGNTEKVDRIRLLTPPHIQIYGVVGETAEDACNPICSPLDWSTKKAEHKLESSINAEGLWELMDRIQHDTGIALREKDPTSVVFTTHDVSMWHPTTGRILEKPPLVEPWMKHEVPLLSDSDIVVVGSWARMFPLLPEEPIRSFDYRVQTHTKPFTVHQMQEFLDGDSHRYEDVLRTAGGLRISHGSLFYEGPYEGVMIDDISRDTKVFAKGMIAQTSEPDLWRLTFGISDKLFENFHIMDAGVPRNHVVYEHGTTR